jgi:hypothetical protein
MPRQVRIEYPGAMYHAMSRGNRRQDIFLDGLGTAGSASVSLLAAMARTPTRTLVEGCLGI